MDQNNNNFMDSRTLWAILLVGVVWFGWQQYINNKYGQPAKLATVVEAEKQEVEAGPTAAAANVSATPGYNIEEQVAQAPETFTEFNNGLIAGRISSKGMALKGVSLAKFKDKNGELIQFSGGQSGMFATYIGGQAVDFHISQHGDKHFIGVAEVSGLKIQKRMSLSDDYKLEIELAMESSSGLIPPIDMILEDDVRKLEKGSFLAPAIDTQELFVLNHEGEKEFNLAAQEDGFNSTLSQALLASVNGHYFSSAFINKSDLIPNFSISHKPTDRFLKGTLTYSPGSDRNKMLISGVGFIGPKDISVLESVDPSLLKIVKFGFFSSIAKPLLLTMKWINNFLGNWGWSIIILTFLVRMIVMPLHIMSFRSMKAMQKVQPLIQSLRERYKDDPMTMNREMMELMKRNKVNPMGGCLPMLLQIPVFFALYRVFSESIELYHAPFVFWIHDLSSKDPYFVLPVLMAAVMYLQQKMTPSTMDPAQAKIMQFMPVIFSLMMLSLPSALTLYMFVSTLFGILQQYLFLKDKPVIAVATK